MVEGQLTIDDIQVAKPAPKKKTSNVYAEGEQLSFFDAMEESEEVEETEEQKGDKTGR